MVFQKAISSHFKPLSCLTKKEKTQRNVSPSEQEEDERGPLSTFAFKDVLKKREAVSAMVLEWHPNQADVSRGGLNFTSCLISRYLAEEDSETRSDPRIWDQPGSTWAVTSEKQILTLGWLDFSREICAGIVMEIWYRLPPVTKSFPPVVRTKQCSSYIDHIR
ncbi:hypothetical protein TNCV_4314671 [Trichonephila clavipes]|nr:hypothetical protein TNCV_4314671 [Trichonephila clavipes]